MTISNQKAVLARDIETVWETVTAVDDYSRWRKDVVKTKVINEKKFIEYTKGGYSTIFTITVIKPCKRLEFDMENGNMKGHWTGIFLQKGEKTAVSFTEFVTAKKFYMKPFVKAYLKRQQKQFIADLKKALS